MKVRSQRIIFSYLLFELILLNLSIFLVAQIKYGTELLDQLDYNVFLVLILNLSWIITVIINGSNDYYLDRTLKKRITDHFKASMTFMGIASPVILLAFTETSRMMVFGTFLTFFTLNFLGTWISRYWKWEKPWNHKHIFNGTRLLVVGAQSHGPQIQNFVKRNQRLGYRMVGFLDNDTRYSPSGPVLGKINDLSKILDTKQVDEIVINLPNYQQEDIRYAIETADYHGIRVNLIPDVMPALANRPVYQTTQINDLPVIELRQTSLDQFHNYFLKKAFDLIFSTLLLILISPLLLVIALAIYFDDKGPIFYKPIRKGQGGYEFVCYKFRTMYVNYDESLKGTSTQKDDPRITRVGKFLRKYSLDELPQFLNVLEGKMSVVGPRPHRNSLNDDMQHSVKNYMVRHYIKPGITGWAQVNGWRGPTETEEQKQQRFSHDLHYIMNWSFFLDLKIVWQTVFGKKTHENTF